MEQASAQLKAEQAPKRSGRLNPGAREFQSRQFPSPIFIHSHPNTAPILHPETSLIPDVADELNETKHATESNREAEKIQEESGMPPAQDINEHLQDLGAMPAKLEETLETMQNACNDIFAWKNIATRALAGEGDGGDCEEAFKEFRKAWETQKRLVGEFRTHLRRASDRLAKDSVGDEERDLIRLEAFESLM